MPGGLVARIVAAGAGAVLPFPLVGYLDDGQQTEIVFLDNAPTPLSEASPPPKVVFPAGTFSAAQKLAYYVAQTVFEADYLTATGIQIAADGSGRLSVLATQLDPTKASYTAWVGLDSESDQLNLYSPTKTVRILRVKLLWPGLRTVAGLVQISFNRYQGDSDGADVTSNVVARRDLTGGAATTCILRHHVATPGAVIGPFALPDFYFVMPASVAAFQPLSHELKNDPAKPLLIAPGASFGVLWDTDLTGLGYDGKLVLQIDYTEE